VRKGREGKGTRKEMGGGVEEKEEGREGRKRERMRGRWGRRREKARGRKRRVSRGGWGMRGMDGGGEWSGGREEEGASFGRVHEGGEIKKDCSVFAPLGAILSKKGNILKSHQLAFLKHVEVILEKKGSEGVRNDFLKREGRGAVRN